MTEADHLRDALRDVRRALLAADPVVGPVMVAVLLERVNDALGITVQATNNKARLPMRCEGESRDPSGGCYYCGASADKRFGPRCPRRQE